MLTLDRKAQPLALVDERAVQPTLLGGVLFLGLEIVPLTAPGPMSLLRVLGFFGLLAIGVGLMIVGRPRVVCRPVPGRAGVAPERLELGGEELPPIYRVTLVLADRSRHTVLESPDPGRVLEDAARLATALDVPLGSGWGLGAHAIAELIGTSPRAVKSFASDDGFTLQNPALAGQRMAAYTTLWASAFVLVASFVMSDGPERKGLVPSALSLVLPCLGALILLVIGLWLLGLREQVTLTPRSVTRRRFWFKRELALLDAREMQVLGAALVRPGSRSDGHVVIASDAGLFALPASAPDGARLLETRAPDVPPAERAAE